MVDFVSRALDYCLKWDDFHSRPIRVGYSYYSSCHGLVVPAGYIPRYTYRELETFWAAEFSWIYSVSELMRWSLIDETIPYRANETVFGIYDGGRRTNALALGMIRYHPALPELREAMLHDLDRDMRNLCVEAIGMMGPRAVNYAKDVRQATSDSKDNYFKCRAVDTLVQLGDGASVAMLCDLFEEVVYQIRQVPFQETDTNLLLLLEAIVKALIRFDENMAREVIAICLAEGERFRHFAKRAAFFTGEYELTKLMDSNPNILIGFLPKDPKWSFSARWRKR